MDEFGVLTERYGLKPQGKSAPMASSKRPANFGVGSGLNSSGSDSNSDYGFFQSGSDGFPDDIFGGPIKPTKQSDGFDFDSMFSGSKSASFSSYNDAYDVFDVMPGLKSSVSAKNIANEDDFFGSFASVPKHSAPADDLLGDLSGAREKLRTLNVKNGKNVKKFGKVGKNGDDSGDLIPGFGESTPSNNGTHKEKSSDQQSTVHSTKTNYGSSLEQDPFVVLDAVSTSTSTSKPAYDFTVLEQISKLGNSQGVKLGGSPDSSRKLKSPPNPAQASKVDPVVDAQTNNRRGNKPQNPAPTPIFDDLFSLTDGAFPVFNEFKEVEGESEERRRSRLTSHQKIQERQLQAVAEMNRRDRQIQQEQEEKSRIAETLDNKIKSWSYGKEGNMRALLSSLQCVLWPESGWVPVTLTDLIASRDVKKVYMKARLCVHPDKVQQKGAEQKYTAEKVFYILQEGWNKFQKEELS